MKKILSISILIAILVFAAQAGTKAEVLKISRQTVRALKSKNMTTLAAVVHPTKGVRFTSYNFVDKGADLVFKSSQITEIWNSKKIYIWGEFDGSGDPINMTFSKYFGKFVYDRDFANARSVKYDTAATLSSTNNNLGESYPKAKFVSYHFEKGPPPRYNEMGWESLYLIFEKSGKKWYLVGISHDQWTI